MTAFWNEAVFQGNTLKKLYGLEGHSDYPRVRSINLQIMLLWEAKACCLTFLNNYPNFLHIFMGQDAVCSRKREKNTSTQKKKTIV